MYGRIKRRNFWKSSFHLAYFSHILGHMRYKIWAAQPCYLHSFPCQQDPHRQFIQRHNIDNPFIWIPIHIFLVTLYNNSLLCPFEIDLRMFWRTISSRKISICVAKFTIFQNLLCQVGDLWLSGGPYILPMDNVLILPQT